MLQFYIRDFYPWLSTRDGDVLLVELDPELKKLRSWKCRWTVNPNAWTLINFTPFKLTGNVRSKIRQRIKIIFSQF